MPDGPIPVDVARLAESAQRETGITPRMELNLRMACPVLAPLVVNGAVGYVVTCQRPKGHDGEHRLTVEWSTDMTRVVISDVPREGTVSEGQD